MLPSLVFGQHFFRIEGDFSIKEKSDLNAQLTIGHFYYDVNLKKIVYNVSFPEKQTLIQYDTNFYQMKGNVLLKRSKSMDISQFSIYHLCLNNALTNYGLDGSFYSIDKVEYEEDMIITTWVPGKKYKKIFGRVITSVKDKKLFGIVFYNADDVIIGKQFFEDYMEIEGLAFPGKMVKITYLGDTKSYQITTYENIKLNNTSETYFYNYPLPDY
jgi:hypothetical protein